MTSLMTLRGAGMKCFKDTDVYRGVLYPFRFLPRLLIGVRCLPSGLSAQAWLFPKGEGTVATSYQRILVRNHAFAEGVPVDIGHSLSHAAIADVDYSISGRLAVRVGLPFVAGKY